MDVKDWCLKLLTGRLVPNHDPSFDGIMLFASLCMEAIWIERNLIIHNKEGRDAESINRSLMVQMQNYLQALSTNQALDQSIPMQVIWVSPPPPCWIKVNVNTTVRDEKAMGATVARDTHSRTLATRTAIC
ncbi:hypothetical protein TorRG33x02_209550 [Trema orientale]|uniref:Uncharacterized protein n=1 Tax=Trema orientale TaxID=63057 RepID=A0A2P5ECI0_TREOI|nr:hypothetical protein TorRG33x02_209550 [Trema orientale]